MTSDWIGLPGARGIDDQELRATHGVLKRGALYRGAGLSMPRESRLCELELSSEFQRRFVVLMNSGTSAMLAALAALDVKDADEVVIPGYGWLTDLSAVLWRRAVPVLCPIGDDLTIDCRRIEECLSERTRAIIPVHACGLPCDMDCIAEIARRHELVVIEDACQALGASLRQAPVGSFGEASVLSFQAFKVVTGGEGGALLTDDETVYRSAVRFHDGGLERFAYPEGSQQKDSSPAGLTPKGIGLNLRISEVTAALIRVQLQRRSEVQARLRAARDDLARSIWEAVQVGLIEPVQARTGGAENGAFLVVRAASERVARVFHDAWHGAGCAARIAGEARLHGLPGWLEYLERESLPHRVVDREATRAILSRTLLLEVNWKLTTEMLERLHGGTQEALRRLG